MVESSYQSEALSRAVEDNLRQARPEVRRFLLDNVQRGLIHYSRLLSASFINKFNWKFEVGFHEGGHKVAAEAEKATVLNTSVETPKAEGIMEFNLGSRPLVSALRSLMVIAQASRAAEQVMGKSDHSGCAGDDAQTQAAAMGLSFGGLGNVGVMIGFALSHAKGLAGMNHNNLTNISYDLLQRQVVKSEHAYAAPGFREPIPNNVVPFRPLTQQQVVNQPALAA